MRKWWVVGLAGLFFLAGLAGVWLWVKLPQSNVPSWFPIKQAALAEPVVVSWEPELANLTYTDARGKTQTMLIRPMVALTQG